MDEVHGKEESVAPQRAHEQMIGDSLEYDLQREIELLRVEEAYRHGRNSKTLVKYPDFRVVLVVIKGGVRIQEHTAAGRISVQAVAGHIRMHVRGTVLDLRTGRLLVIDRDIPHDVEAVDDSAFLLTIAWPKEIHDR
jgi:quercetin dioxygenase-like cupin family protein